MTVRLSLEFHSDVSYIRLHILRYHYGPSTLFFSICFFQLHQNGGDLIAVTNACYMFQEYV